MSLLDGGILRLLMLMQFSLKICFPCSSSRRSGAGRLGCHERVSISANDSACSDRNSGPSDLTDCVSNCILPKLNYGVARVILLYERKIDKHGFESAVHQATIVTRTRRNQTKNE